MNRKTILTAVILLIVAVDIALLQYVQGRSDYPLLPLAVALDFCLVIPILKGLC
jgi:hypothetical protein